MHKHLIIHAFKRAKEIREQLGEHNPSKTSRAEDISMFLEEKRYFRLSGRQLNNYFNKALNIRENSMDIKIKQPKVILGLCRYLGFNNYQDFINDEKCTFSEIVYSKSTNEFPVLIKIRSKKSHTFSWYSTMSTVE